MSSSAATRRPSFLSAVQSSPATKVNFAGARLVEEVRPPAPEALPPIAAAPTEQRTLERFDLAISLLRSQGERLAEQARGDALELAFLVARRILDHELHADPAALLGLIRSALRRAGEANKITVRLAPGDCQRVRAMDPAQIEGGLSLAHVELVADATLELGDCVVETELGAVDGRLATRLAEMREAVDSGLAAGGA